MKILSTISIIILLLLIRNSASFCQNATTAKKIDIVICLDLSASTNGMIDRFRESYWNILNEINKLSPTPQIRIGIVAGGRNSYGKENYYVKQLSDLTDDFDALYEGMSKIRTKIEGCDTYVGKEMEI